MRPPRDPARLGNTLLSPALRAPHARDVFTGSCVYFWALPPLVSRSARAPAPPSEDPGGLGCPRAGRGGPPPSALRFGVGCAGPASPPATLRDWLARRWKHAENQWKSVGILENSRVHTHIHIYVIETFYRN